MWTGNLKYHVGAERPRNGAVHVKVNQNLLSWVGYQPDAEDASPEAVATAAVDRIQQLEARIAELEAQAPRLDLASLTPDEVELVASEAAVVVIKAAQAREAAARAEVQRIKDDAARDVASHTAALKSAAEAEARELRELARAEQERVATWVADVEGKTLAALERNRKLLATCIESIQQMDALLSASEADLRTQRTATKA